MRGGKEDCQHHVEGITTQLAVETEVLVSIVPGYFDFSSVN